MIAKPIKERAPKTFGARSLQTYLVIPHVRDCALEFLAQGNVPKTITDRVKRCIVVVVECS
jgi:hypothetical protein